VTFLKPGFLTLALRTFDHSFQNFISTWYSIGHRTSGYSVGSIDRSITIARNQPSPILVIHATTDHHDPGEAMPKNIPEDDQPIINMDRMDLHQATSLRLEAMITNSGFGLLFYSLSLSPRKASSSTFFVFLTRTWRARPRSCSPW